MGFNVFYSGNALDGCMDIGLTCYTSGFLEEGADGGSCADAVPTGPAFCDGVVHPCGDVLEWRHAWGKQVQVGDVRYQLKVIDGKESAGIIICENVGSYGGDKC